MESVSSVEFSGAHTLETMHREDPMKCRHNAHSATDNDHAIIIAIIFRCTVVSISEQFSGCQRPGLLLLLYLHLPHCPCDIVVVCYPFFFFF